MFQLKIKRKKNLFKYQLTSKQLQKIMTKKSKQYKNNKTKKNILISKFKQCIYKIQKIKKFKLKLKQFNYQR